ncbi:hypothetical protein DK28_0211640 [Peptococcaceae bacterium SCADC1_2_3]|nr:hypothetical protein DK28_0211640 [Peptococcaceae bacterium SCADC1_2_3]KFI36104.1 hypothetical protein HY00_07395 [Peptococcaceae bacterium SCADC1_2_3]
MEETTTRFLVVAGLTAIIHLINTLIYSVRLAGVKTQRVATAISLFQVVFLVASTANLIQAPLMSSIVEHAINAGLKHLNTPDFLTSPFYQEQLAHLRQQIRMVILAGTVGTLLGALCIPFFVNFFSRAILMLEDVGSVPKMFFKMVLSPFKMVKLVKKSEFSSVNSFWAVLRGPLRIPRYFLLANILITGIWTIGVLSALYAGALLPQFRSTATLTSGIVNGVAAILAATVVDPTAAMITDQAVRGAREEADVRQMAIYLALTRFAGTLLAQFFFLPAASIIRWVAELIT